MHSNLVHGASFVDSGPAFVGVWRPALIARIRIMIGKRLTIEALCPAWLNLGIPALAGARG